MKVVIPFHKGDFDQFLSLLSRIEELGDPVEAIIACNYLPLWMTNKAIEAATRTFQSFDLILFPDEVRGWPQGPNYSFLFCIKHIFTKRLGPFLFLEPDAVPLKRGWLAALEKAYEDSPAEFVGSINKREYDGFTHFSGVGMYSENAYLFWKDHLPSPKAFDMINQEEILIHAEDTKLIQNFWGAKNLPPTFKENREKSDPLNTMILSQIRKEAVLFHRNKDLTLVELLREKEKVSNEIR